jgi:hypothetical protein
MRITLAVKALRTGIAPITFGISEQPESGILMRILDEVADQSLSVITIYLTEAEAEELRDSLEQLLANWPSRHEHVSSSDYKKQITVCIYDAENLEGFDARSKQLINED